MPEEGFGQHFVQIGSFLSSLLTCSDWISWSNWLQAFLCWCLGEVAFQGSVLGGFTGVMLHCAGGSGCSRCPQPGESNGHWNCDWRKTITKNPRQQWLPVSELSTPFFLAGKNLMVVSKTRLSVLPSHAWATFLVFPWGRPALCAIGSYYWGPKRFPSQYKLYF